MRLRKLRTRDRLFWGLLIAAIALCAVSLLFAWVHRMTYVGGALLFAFLLFVIVLFTIGREEVEEFER